ncbi:hypothetical protein F8S13_19955 [Chloroflexia bacterium SDU3-3]|nr:hypothetical protein F8S13_19955 [Chloroflexia bacterium SDU3-3]
MVVRGSLCRAAAWASVTKLWRSACGPRGYAATAARTWYTADTLGSVRLTTSDTGAALSSIDDDPWGQVERGAPARFGFTGELQQGSSVHLRARWYNAASGSFASVDPYAGDPASPASLAPYMYAYNQPTLFTDPSGRCIAWLDPYCKSVDWFILEAVQGRVHEYSGFHDSALYFAGVADGVASPVKTVYALTQPQTWQNVGRGYQYLKEHPQEGSNILKEEYVDPVVRGGSFVLSNLATPGNIMHRVNDKPYEIGQVLGSNAPIGVIGKFALRNLMPYRSLMMGGQEASTLCTTSAPKVAKLKLFPYKLLPGQEGFVPRMTGLFDPMAERFRGLVTPEHVAVRNLDGSITDRTILMNISRANKWILPAELEKFRGIDTFDLRTYNKLLDTWQDLFTKGLDANGISKTWNNLSKGLIEQDTTPNQNGGGLDIPDDFWQLPDDY